MMGRAFLKWVVGVFAAVCCVPVLLAQQPQVATTVQLPTFSVFTVQTTVSVPDGGGAYLGGINRGIDGSLTRGIGPLRNRSSGGSRVASGISVSTTVIDHDEIDRALLADAAAKRSTAGTDFERAATNADASKAAALTKSLGHGGASRLAAGRDGGSSVALPGSVAAIRESYEAADAAEAAELAGHLKKAQQAEAENKLGLAKIYYQMVARRDKGNLKRQAESRLAAIASATATKR